MRPQSAPAAPLADVLCGDLVESCHVGHGVAVDRHGAVVAWFGDPQRLTFLRSSGKLVQALPTVESGALEAFDVTSAELAVICASHRGEAPGRCALDSDQDRAWRTGSAVWRPRTGGAWRRQAADRER